VKDAAGRTPLDVAMTPVQGQPVPNRERIGERIRAASSGG
jgi:hypothetical protein